MLFNSLEFILFVPLIFVLYWFATGGNLKIQNALVLFASYIFYGWWDWRFLTLIFVSSVVDYTVGLALGKTETPRKRKLLLMVSLVTNLGLLGFFKYYNFFIGSFVDLFGSLGIPVSPSSLQLILPVGISFYTFQTLSYTIDIYRGKMQPTHDVVAFFAFVGFFPQLVAGPIERASNLLPQFMKKRSFNPEKAKDGLRQILWGLAKKIIVADNVSVKVDVIFGNPGAFSGIDLFLGIFFFAIQIYCDFSGYSDIAIGTARLFGFDLMRNFAYPYFSRDFAEFWRRWHISLTTWFRDYVYIPLGGNKSGKIAQSRNILITFTVSGLWHGANWHYIFWGFLNGLLTIPVIFTGKKKRRHTDMVAEGRIIPAFPELWRLVLTFLLSLVPVVFFRAESMSGAFNYLGLMFSNPWLQRPTYLMPVLFCFLVLAAEWFQRSRPHGLAVEHLPMPLRWALYYIVFFGMLFFGNFSEKAFVYFQF